MNIKSNIKFALIFFYFSNIFSALNILNTRYPILSNFLTIPLLCDMQYPLYFDALLLDQESKQEYFKELDCQIPKNILDEIIQLIDLAYSKQKLSPEEYKKAQKEFDRLKADLKKNSINQKYNLQELINKHKHNGVTDLKKIKDIKISQMGNIKFIDAWHNTNNLKDKALVITFLFSNIISELKKIEMQNKIELRQIISEIKKLIKNYLPDFSQYHQDQIILNLKKLESYL